LGLLIAEPITSLNGTGVAAAGALRNLANGNTWSGALTLAAATRVNSDAGTLTLSGAITGAFGLTVGGVGNTTIGSIIGTGTGTVTKDGAGTLTLSAVNTYTGATTINAGIVSIAANSGLGTAPGAATPGNLTFGGGTLQTTADFTLTATRGVALGVGGSTIDVAAGTTLVYSGIATGTGSLTKTSTGTLDLSGATVTVGGITISSGTVVGPSATGFNVNGAWVNNAATNAFTGGAGTVTLSGGSPQSVDGSFATTFNGLKIQNASGITLGADATVTGTLTFTTGNVTTGVHTLDVAAGGTVSRTSGHVVGNFEKHFATGTPFQTFEVGDATTYAPVTVAFDSVTVAGDLTVSTTAGEHPAIGTSTIDPTKSVNRYWTMANSGITFTTYSATFTFAAGDRDAGVDPLHIVVETYSGGTWNPEVAGTRLSTSTQATGVGAFGDFAIGELTGAAFDHFDVTAPATVTAGSPFDVTVTSVDSAGNTLTGYIGTITFSSTDAYGAFSPLTYTFVAGDFGTKTLTSVATLTVAGSQTISVTDSVSGGTSAPITVGPAAFTQLQILVPGELPDPGSLTGRTGTPTVQTANTAFNVSVNAVDAYWNITSSTDTVAITSSDADAVLPSSAALVAGSGSFSIALEAGGSATVTATDVTDGSKTASTSTAVSVTNTAPVVTNDTYAGLQDNALVIAGPGVLSNDSDPEDQAIQVAAPRPVSGPSHGSLALNADGSFTYTPNTGYSGLDTFTYNVTDGYLASSDATVTINVTSTAYLSSSDWPTAFDGNRYLSLTFPSYVPDGSEVTGATFRHSYRSETAGDTTCYFFEVYNGATLLGTHGSAGTPTSCNATSSFATDTVALPEIASVADANAVTIVLYVWNSGGHSSLHELATLRVDYSHD
jgi:autotransporter-associated beta strand protein/VCBS repeat-containing protein